MRGETIYYMFDILLEMSIYTLYAMIHHIKRKYTFAHVTLEVTFYRVPLAPDPRDMGSNRKDSEFDASYYYYCASIL